MAVVSIFRLLASTSAVRIGESALTVLQQLQWRSSASCSGLPWTDALFDRSVQQDPVQPITMALSRGTGALIARRDEMKRHLSLGSNFASIF
jgi:hypothetical protein